MSVARWVVAASALLAATPAAGWAQDMPAGWVKTPSASDLDAVWPAAALRAGQGGRVLLNCLATTSGVLADCRIRSETPPDLGFGPAALLLTPNIVMRPAMHDGEPTASRVVIPILFKTYGGPHEPSTAASLRIVPWAPWIRAPSYAELLAAEPAQAKGAAGFVSMRCEFRDNGGLQLCDPITETPRGMGFARAAKALAADFRTSAGPGVRQGGVLQVAISIQFPGAQGDASARRYVTQPDWTRTVSGPELFPAAARAAGVRTGAAVLDCRIGTEGALEACAVAAERPVGLGFATAAMSAAGQMRMNLWNRDGLPTPGAYVRLPVRLTDSAPVAPAPTP